MYAFDLTIFLCVLFLFGSTQYIKRGTKILNLFPLNGFSDQLVSNNSFPSIWFAKMVHHFFVVVQHPFENPFHRHSSMVVHTQIFIVSFVLLFKSHEKCKSTTNNTELNMFITIDTFFCCLAFLWNEKLPPSLWVLKNFFRPCKQQ